MRYFVWTEMYETREANAQKIEASSLTEAVEKYAEGLFDDFGNQFLYMLDEGPFTVYVKGLLNTTIERKISYEIEFKAEI